LTDDPLRESSEQAESVELEADEEQGKQRRTAFDLLKQLFSQTLTMLIFPVHRVT